MTLCVMRGFEARDDALILDLIDQAGPGGEFMSQGVTAKRCRAEIWNPMLMDRQPRGAREWLTLYTPVTSRQELR